MQECLMVKTKDNRKFLTYERHLPSLIEFAKTERVEIYRVQTSAKILELKPLAREICETDYKGDPEFERIEKVFPTPKRSRQEILKEADSIRRYVRKKLLSGAPVSLKDLKSKYKENNLTDACLCNHLATMRRSLVNEGREFKKLGAGKYCLIE